MPECYTKVRIEIKGPKDEIRTFELMENQWDWSTEDFVGSVMIPLAVAIGHNLGNVKREIKDCLADDDDIDLPNIEEPTYSPNRHIKESNS